MFSCGKTDENVDNNDSINNKDIDLIELQSKILDLVKEDEPLTIDKSSIADLYYFDNSLLDDSFGIITMEGSFPGEMIVCKAKSADDAKTISASFENKLADIKVQSKNYDEVNFQLAQTCKVVVIGKYVSFFVHAKHSEMEKLFEDSFK